MDQSNTCVHHSQCRTHTHVELSGFLTVASAKTCQPCSIRCSIWGLLLTCHTAQHGLAAVKFVANERPEISTGAEMLSPALEILNLFWGHRTIILELHYCLGSNVTLLSFYTEDGLYVYCPTTCLDQRNMMQYYYGKAIKGRVWYSKMIMSTLRYYDSGKLVQIPAVKSNISRQHQQQRKYYGKK